MSDQLDFPAIGDPLFDDLSAGGFESTPLWEVGDVTRQVVLLYQRDRLPESTARDALHALAVTEPDGTRWAFGATTQRWYRQLPGDAWRLARPPAEVGPLTVPCRDAVARALQLLHVDPDTVEPAAPVAVAAPRTGEAPEALLDSLLGGYGDE